MSSIYLFDWHQFKKDFIDPGTPVVEPLTLDKRVSVSWSNEGGLSLLLDTSGLGALDYEHIGFEIIRRNNKNKTRIFVNKAVLNTPFFTFISQLANEYDATNSDLNLITKKLLKDFELFTKGKNLMGENEEVGLIGELIILKRLIESKGEEAVASWFGPLRTRHDFTLKDLNLEVKTTLRNDRHHRITSLGQLDTSKPLFIASIKLDKTKYGFSLNSLIPEILNLLKKPDLRQRFKELCKSNKVNIDELHEYNRKYDINGEIKLIDLKELPLLERKVLNHIYSPTKLARLVSLQYTINCNDLGTILNENFISNTRI